MPRRKVLREVSPKKDLKQRSVSIDTPLKWIELSRELLKLGCPPEDLQRIKGSKWEVVFPTEEQAQEVGGSRWRVGIYTLLPFYLGNRKEAAAPAAPVVTPEELRERAEKESKKTQKEYMRDRKIESSINSLCESVASLILKVSNEHKTSSGALPLMHSDTNTTQTHTTQTSEGGPADTTMRLNTGKQEVGIGGSRGPSTYSFPGPFIPPTGLTTAASIGANKYPTDTVITPVQGHKPLMSQDTPKQGKDTKTKGEEDVVMGEESTTPPTPPAKEEQERKEAQEARRKDAQDAVRKAGEVVRRDEVMREAQVAQEAT